MPRGKQPTPPRPEGADRGATHGRPPDAVVEDDAWRLRQTSEPFVVDDFRGSDAGSDAGSDNDDALSDTGLSSGDAADGNGEPDGVPRVNHHSGWQRFTKKVVSAAGSFDPGSLQIPQRLLHLANDLALRDRDKAVPLMRGGRLINRVAPSEFVKHEKDSAIATTRYLVLGEKYIGGTDDVTTAIAEHQEKLSSWHKVRKVLPVLSVAPGPKGGDPRGVDPPARFARSRWHTHVTDAELERVIAHREFMTNPHQDHMVELTQGDTFGLVRPGIGATMRPPPKAGSEEPVHHFRAPTEVRPFARMCGSAADDGVRLYKVLCEEWGLDVPRVVVSVVGDRRVPSRLSTAEQLSLQEALSAASFSDSIWFLTTGWELGLAGLVGQYVGSSQNPAAVIGVSAWELLETTETGRGVIKALEGCRGRLRPAVCLPQESHREKTRADAHVASVADDAAGGPFQALPHSIAVQHSHHVFVDTGVEPPSAYRELGNDGDEQQHYDAILKYEQQSRKAERKAILRLLQVLANDAHAPLVQSYGSFGVRSSVVPLALVVAGGADTLVDALSYITNGVPLVVADGCVGASAAIALRWTIAKEEDKGEKADQGKLEGLRHEYDALVEDSFLGECSVAGVGKVRDVVRQIITTAVEAEKSSGAQMIFIGTLGAEELTARPEAAILRAVNAHPSYRRVSRNIDASIGSVAAQVEHRARRALRIETAIKWKMVSTPGQQLEEFRYFRVLPTLASDHDGHPMDPVLESQLQMLKYVLSDFVNKGGYIAQLCLDNITDRHLRQCLEYTIVPPPEGDDVNPVETQVRRWTSLDDRAYKALRRRAAVRVPSCRRRVERKVPRVPPELRASSASLPASGGVSDASIESAIVDMFDDSDYTLPVHLSKVSFVNDVTDCVIRAWVEKRRLQRERAGSEEAFVVRGAEVDDDEYAGKYRRQFASVAIVLIKFMLANGNLICRRPKRSHAFTNHVRIIAPEERLPFPDHRRFCEKHLRSVSLVSPSKKARRSTVAKVAADAVQSAQVAVSAVGSTIMAVAGTLLGHGHNALGHSTCPYEGLGGEVCGRALHDKRFWCAAHACPLCFENEKPEDEDMCDACALEDSSQRRAFKHLRNKLAAYRLAEWKERKRRARPPWEPGEVYTPWRDGERRDPGKKWLHPGLEPDTGLQDSVCFHHWYAEELLERLLKYFVIYRTTTLEDLYAFGGDTVQARRELAHMSVLFPEGLFTSSFVCHKVDTWLGVPPRFRGLVQQHEVEDPFFALFIWALLTNRLRIALVMLCKRPGEIAINALVGATVCTAVLREIRGGTAEVDVGAVIQIKYEKFRAQLIRIAWQVLHTAYLSDSEKTVHAIQSQWPNSGGIEMWRLAYAIKAGEITSMPAVRDVVQQEWWGNVDPSNSFIKILLGILTFGLWCLFWTPHDAFDYHNGRNPSMRNAWYLPLRVSAARGNGGRIEGPMINGSGTSVFPNAPGDGSFRSWRLLAGRRMYRFFLSAQVSFFVEVLFWLLYLLIYSYASLLTPRPWIYVFSFRSEWIGDDVIQMLSLIFIITHVIQEGESIARELRTWSFDGVIAAVSAWWDSHWNKLDFVMSSIILLGCALKLSTEDFELQVSKLLIAIGGLLLWLRSMRFFAKSPALGPKTLSMYRMTADFAVFGALLFTSLVGTGVAMYSIAQPWRGVDDGTVIDVLFKPTFIVFGELFLEETFEETGCAVSNAAGWRSCNFNWYVVIFMLIVFSLYSNILLVNLLIAMMGATYESVEASSDRLWSLQNIALLDEMHEQFPNPPPLNIVAYLFRACYAVYSRVVDRRGRRRVHPQRAASSASRRGASESRVRLTQHRRDIVPLSRIVAFLEPHGVAATKELGLLGATGDSWEAEEGAEDGAHGGES